MPLGEHTNPTFGDLQDRIQCMRHTSFLHKYNLSDRHGNRTRKSLVNYIDHMDSESALSLQVANIALVLALALTLALAMITPTTTWSHLPLTLPFTPTLSGMCT
jgi:hypothetical protein